MAALAVFDGHGGPQAASMASVKVFQELLPKSLDLLQQEPLPPDYGWIANFWVQHLQASFESVQQKLDSEKAVGGTVANVVVVDKQTGLAVLSWIGDAQALHARRIDGTWQVLYFSQAHQCIDDEEWISEAHSLKDHWCDRREKPYACRGHRTSGPKSCIGTTRALGNFGLIKSGLLVLSKPQTKTLFLRQGDLLLSASDGLWDVVTPQDILADLTALSPSGCDNVRSLGPSLALEAERRWQAHGFMDDVSLVAWCAELLG
eukprot:CAMPEP_0197673376 /NCGR_PEP_ID=MMETSP1338-20131121/80819_1 /TAXON_ID=43686 ORGANISM="Pelagodinium beii, Strain RCC1491" /NCGR_SAMPLE_ID=MMETSP1338 /ASSEMBLY_ACC=CAM_ASM_000754 /LENGTH=260 /DNA_ID=CAMNT_0043253617 /DNA_START=33 /DNA_END=811 /DNA_ORIENTATION=+